MILLRNSMPPNLDHKRFYLLLIGYCAILGTIFGVVGVSATHLLPSLVSRKAVVFGLMLSSIIGPLLSGFLLREFRRGRYPWLRSDPLPPRPNKALQEEAREDNIY